MTGGDHQQIHSPYSGQARS